MPFKCWSNSWPPPVHIHYTFRFPEGEWQSYKDDNLWRESSAEMREKQRLEADMINDVRQAAEVHRQVRHVCVNPRYCVDCTVRVQPGRQVDVRASGMARISA
jgi:hypothetical protein